MSGRPDLTTTSPEASDAGKKGVARRTHGQLGRYRLAFELASGGMATVFMAHASGAGGFGKVVAIKRIHPHLAGEESYVNMFLDEARLASRIHHPNVCSVIDFGEADGTYFLVMEYLLGMPLNKVIPAVARLESPPKRWPAIASRLAADAAEGLHAAHELRGADGRSLGVVHRDVSPHNLFLGFDGQIRVVDFGIAKAAGRLHQTNTGEMKGKFAYMAPEQIERGEIDRRTDVWALGVVLWEMLALGRLFRRGSEAETMYAVLEAPVAPPKLDAVTIPDSVNAACLRALQRDVAARSPDARTFGRDVRRAWSEDPIGVADPPEIAELLRELFPGEEERQRTLVELARQPDDEVPRVDGWAGDVGTDSFSQMTPGEMRAVGQVARKRWKLIAAVLAGTTVTVGALLGALLPKRERDDASLVASMPSASAPAVAAEDPQGPHEEVAERAAAPVAAADEPASATPEPSSPAVANGSAPSPDEPLSLAAANEPAPSRTTPRRPVTRPTPTEREHLPEPPAPTRPAGVAPSRPPEETRPADGPGHVVVVVPGGWANVYDANNRFLGATPLRRELAPGRHTLLLRFSGEPPDVPVTVEVTAGGTTRLSRRPP